MTIILSTQADVATHDGTNILLNDQFGANTNPDSDQSVPQGGFTKDALALRNFAGGILEKLIAKRDTSADHSFVGSGKQLVVGGGAVSGNKVSPIEAASERVYATQSPNFSVIIKKRAFSGLRDLYKPELMGPGEAWLVRATKRVIARKCAIMADYERLTKIDKLTDLGASPSAIMYGLLTATELGTNLVTGESNTDAKNKPEFEALKELQKAAFDRQPVRTTKYYIDPDLPVLEEFGIGQGVFETTAVSTLTTNLDLDGNGSCSFTIEDPYHILFITEEDIEISLRETANSAVIQLANKTAALRLSIAQDLDKKLNDLRSDRGRSPVSFTVDVRGGGAVAILDSIGYEVTAENAPGVPSEQAFDAEELKILKRILDALTNYAEAMLNGFKYGTADERSADMDYARKRMRQFYLGKSIMQAMDSVHIYIDGGTRRAGEGELANETDSTGYLTIDGTVKLASNAEDSSRDQLQLDEDLLDFEREKSKSNLSKDDYIKLRALDFGGGSGIHVFGGLIQKVGDRYDADSGKYILSVECSSNMEWLKLSRYNTSPSMDQTEGIVFDPLTPFIIETDQATALPTGKISWSPENKRRIEECKLRFNDGPDIGKKVTDENSSNQDARLIGGNLLPLFQHAPGLLYRWKDGIMTATYNMQTIDPKNKTSVDKRQLRRDVGFFSSNTPFDNMDAANIVSIMVTGFPYNYTTFVQSAMQTGAFIPDTTLNSANDFFHSFLDVRRSVSKVQGNFVPFKEVKDGARDSLSAALSLQHQLSSTSTKLSQLRNKEAKLIDKINELRTDAVVGALHAQLANLRTDLTEAENEFDERLKNGGDIKNNIVRISGDDIVLDILPGKDDQDKFGDRLLFESIRKRENTIYAKDKNLFIVSDEYDKDFDIQAFVLRLRDQSPNLWKSTWQSAHELCTKVAEILNFEFFCNSQGHIVFRPPQYNRTPLSVLQGMFLLNQLSGIKVFPEFLTKLFKKREENIINDVKILEWEIQLNAALLGAENSSDAEKKVFQKEGSDLYFLYSTDDTTSAISKNKPQDPADERSNKDNIKRLQGAGAYEATVSSGIFSSKAQRNLQDGFIENNKKTGLVAGLKTSVSSNKEFYEKAKNELIKATGRQNRSFAEFDKAKVGADRNGQKTPVTDVANIISDISNLVSRRSRLLVTLERVLDQNIQVAELNEDGTSSKKGKSLAAITKHFDTKLTGVAAKLVEDTRRDILGHLSGQRFIIKDEHIRSYNFSEQPPDMTKVTVTGTDPIVGEGQGNVAGGMPLYLAYGVDFDMWRQYGWRGEKDFDKPFFWSAELQCAPYAVMLLSRQRKNVIKGSITVYGNEFYQLGDVVYVTDRQLLYYVNGVSHNVSYDGQFTTTLQLTYGHPPGEYIPTPLDVIGKSMTSKAASQNSFRMRRQTPVSESPVRAILRFPESDSADITVKDLVAGKDGARNFNEMKKFSSAIKSEFLPDIKTSPRVYILTFTDNKDHEKQMKAVQDWLIEPVYPVVGGNSSGPDGSDGSNPEVSSANDEQLKNMKLPKDKITIQNIRQCIPSNIKLNNSEEELLRSGLVASDGAYTLDKTLKSIVELRLRFPPSGGWT